MAYFIFRACWSQTDQSNIIVEADSKTHAESKLKESPFNPHHWDYIGRSEAKILK